MRAEASPTAQHMMVGMNFWSSLCSGFVLIVSGEGVQFVQFVSRHPVALVHIAALAITGALGQLFIFLTVCFIHCTLLIVHLRQSNFYLQYVIF